VQRTIRLIADFSDKYELVVHLYIS